jgi:hypothetical protein
VDSLGAIHLLESNLDKVNWYALASNPSAGLGSPEWPELENQKANREYNVAFIRRRSNQEHTL